MSDSWNEAYLAGLHSSVWPWTDLISCCERYVWPRIDSDHTPRVLELGAGVGANIPYFLSKKCDYYGIDSSLESVRLITQAFPQMAKRVRVADFTQEIPFSETFDVIVDRGSVTCNSLSGIQSCLDLVTEKLNPNGLFVGVTWYSNKHTSSNAGVPWSQEDRSTRREINEGPLSGIDPVHFTDEKELRELFSELTLSLLVESVRLGIEPDPGYSHAFYNLVARKKNNGWGS